MYWSAHYKFFENFKENPGRHQPGFDSSCATSMLHPFQRRQNAPSSRYRSCNDLKLQRSLVTCSFPCQCDYIGIGGFDLRECDEMAGVLIHLDSSWFSWSKWRMKVNWLVCHLLLSTSLYSNDFSPNLCCQDSDHSPEKGEGIAISSLTSEEAGLPRLQRHDNIVTDSHYSDSVLWISLTAL